MKHKRRQGFTLVEAMLVISLIGLMAAMGAPPFFRYLASNRLAAQADRMVADLQYARSLSVANSQILRFSVTAGGYRLTNPVTGVVLKDIQFCEGLGSTADVTTDFFPWGMANQATINLTGPTSTRSITVLPTGLVEAH